MKFLTLLMVIFTISCQTKASYRQNVIFEDSNESSVMAKCEERICSRIYRPLCVAIDGIQTTLPSRCHMAKFRCDAMKRGLNSSKTSKAPIIRVVHNGGCYEKPKRRQNSKWMKIPEDGKYRGRY